MQEFLWWNDETKMAVVSRTTAILIYYKLKYQSKCFAGHFDWCLIVSILEWANPNNEVDVSSSRIYYD